MNGGHINGSYQSTTRVEVGRVREFIVGFACRSELLTSPDRNGEHGGHFQWTEKLAFNLGLSDRTLRSILAEDQPSVSIRTLDKILCKAHRPDYAHVPRDQGGFADAFDGEIQIIPAPTARQREVLEAHRVRTKRTERRQAQLAMA